MKNKNLLESFNNAINGIIYTIRNERNMKLHTLAAVAVLILSLYCNVSKIEFMIVCLVIALVFVCELFNTAVEVVVDVIVDVYHPKAKIIKDVAAGAVLISSFVAVLTGYFIFFDKISSGYEAGLIKIRQSPIHLTIIAIVITIITVFIIKAYFKKGKPLQGGMPSGHSAVAFSITTAVSLWTDNVKISILCLIVALLVAQSRLEAKIHNIFELAAGGLLGFLITVLMFQLFYR